MHLYMVVFGDAPTTWVEAESERKAKKKIKTPYSGFYNCTIIDIVEVW